MNTKSDRPSTLRWWILAGGIVLFVVAFNWIEGLFGPDLEERERRVDQAVAEAAPDPPEVVRLEQGGIEIRHDLVETSMLRLTNKEKEDELYDCLTQRIEEVFGGGTEGWDSGRVERETLQVRFECLRRVKART